MESATVKTNMCFNLLVFCFLTACATATADRETLRGPSFEKVQICTNMQQDAAFDLLKRELIACYRRTTSLLIPAAPGILVPTTQGTSVEEEKFQDRKSLALRGYANGRPTGYVN